MVSGVGTDRDVPGILRRVVTDLAVLDLQGPGGVMRLVSVHPGVTVEDVQAATGFELHVEDVVESRLPTDEELRLIREVLDPKGLRDREVPPQ
jgi:acyl CoA:acetate/3-ketoacid CoA transferase beta subunit